MKRKIGIIIMLVLSIFVMSYCASIKALFDKTELTPAARYYDALKTFNSNVEQYNAIYKLSDEATKAKWKAQIDPLIVLASNALDDWKSALNSPTATSKEAIWISVQKNLLTLLVSSGILKVEGR